MNLQKTKTSKQKKHIKPQNYKEQNRRRSSAWRWGKRRTRTSTWPKGTMCRWGTSRGSTNKHQITTNKQQQKTIAIIIIRIYSPANSKKTKQRTKQTNKNKKVVGPAGEAQPFGQQRKGGNAPRSQGQADPPREQVPKQTNQNSSKKPTTKTKQ